MVFLNIQNSAALLAADTGSATTATSYHKIPARLSSPSPSPTHQMNKATELPPTIQKTPLSIPVEGNTGNSKTTVFSSSRKYTFAVD
jgi:hypothetical protein